MLTGLPELSVKCGEESVVSLAGFIMWYLKRGFPGFCFFTEDETHSVNLFSGRQCHPGGLLAQISASGNGHRGRDCPRLLTFITYSTNLPYLPFSGDFPR